MVQPGSFRWFNIRFLPIRCIYGLVRTFGLINWDWELSDDFMTMNGEWYGEIVFIYSPFMRMKVLQTGSPAIIVLDLYSNSYMKLYPIFHPTKPSPVYPLDGIGPAIMQSIFQPDNYHHVNFPIDVLAWN